MPKGWPTLGFANAVQQTCYERVADILGGTFAQQLIVNPDRPAFRLNHGSSAVDVTIYPVGPGAFVHLRALVVHGARRDQALAEKLLQQNALLLRGAFGLEADGDIVFVHSMAASAVTDEELRESVVAMLGVADHWDDIIKRGWGGLVTTDRN
jgi:hypothetical protein